MVRVALLLLFAVSVWSMEVDEFSFSANHSRDILNKRWMPITKPRDVPRNQQKSGELPIHVDTPLGSVRGLMKKTLRKNIPYRAFYGMPYAQPPVGMLRFKAPVPADSWAGVYDATYERPACRQSSDVEQDEDCLYINVYVPEMGNNTKDLTVMVFIYGGAFTSGSSNSKIYSPDFLIETGVILVTFNYRLGVFGFLSLQNEEVPGNAGLKDQNLALKWIQDNIRSFGGDPNKVTVFGESAGAASVNFHLLSEQSKGLFQRAIMESGTANCAWAFISGKEAKEKSVALAKKFWCLTWTDNMVLNCLRSKSASELVDKQQETLTISDVMMTRPFMFIPTQEPNVKGAFFPNTPYEFLQKREYINPVPSIIGTNSNEALIAMPVIKSIDKLGILTWLFGLDLSILYPYILRKDLTSAQKRMVHKKFKSFYMDDHSVTLQNLPELSLLMTDAAFVMPVQDQASLLANFTSVYNYVFDYDGPYGYFKRDAGVENEAGVCHADELGYLFLSDGVHPNYPIPSTNEELVKAEEIVDKMTLMWSNFAKYGDPTPIETVDKTGKWFPRTASNPLYMHIAKMSYTRSSELMNLRDRIEFWKDLIKTVS